MKFHLAFIHEEIISFNMSIRSGKVVWPKSRKKYVGTVLFYGYVGYNNLAAETIR